MKKFIILIMLFSVLIFISFTGCKATEEPLTEAREDVVAQAIEEGETAETVSAERSDEDWWVAPKGGEILVTELAEPDKSAGPFVIAHVINDLETQFTIDVWDGFEEAAKEYPNLELHQYDAKNNPEDGLEAVLEVQTLSPDLVIYFNWISAGDVMAEWCEKNEVPEIEIDAPWAENAWFFGLDNKLAGELGGYALSEWVLENWSGEDIWVVQNTEYESGEVVYFRNSEFLKVFLEEVGDAVNIMNLGDDGKVDELNGDTNTELGLQLFTDWLTANPDADRVVVWGSTDEAISGMYAAAKNQGRLDNCVFGSINGTPYAYNIMKEDNRYLGSVTMFPEFYGRGALKTAYAILTKMDVPKIVYAETEWMTMDIIGDYYPEYIE